MKTIILFYSHSGNTKALANKKAKELGADIEEVTEVRKPSMLIGMFRCMKRSKTEINPLRHNLSDYDKIIIMSPVWSSLPVSAINCVIDYLPAGKKVEIIMVSGGGGTKKTTTKTKDLIIKRGCEVVGYIDLRAMRKNGEVFSQVLN